MLLSALLHSNSCSGAHLLRGDALLAAVTPAGPAKPRVPRPAWARLCALCGSALPVLAATTPAVVLLLTDCSRGSAAASQILLICRRLGHTAIGNALCPNAHRAPRHMRSSYAGATLAVGTSRLLTCCEHGLWRRRPPGLAGCRAIWFASDPASVVRCCGDQARVLLGGEPRGGSGAEAVRAPVALGAAEVVSGSRVSLQVCWTLRTLREAAARRDLHSRWIA